MIWKKRNIRGLSAQLSLAIIIGLGYNATLCMECKLQNVLFLVPVLSLHGVDNTNLIVFMEVLQFVSYQEM